MNPSKYFIRFAIFSCVVTVGALLLCHSSHKKSHQRIVTQNQTAFQSYNAILASLPSRIDTINARKQTIMLDIIEDSILNNLPKLPNKQKQALASYVESAVMAASMELPYSSLMDELEASVNSVQISNIQSETKALLELEFNKIQNEYETLALWAGILTVVFLIFSFYSMFKTDELLKQGREGVNELSNLKSEGSNQLAVLISEATASISDFKAKSNNAIRTAAEKALIKKKELVKEIDDTIELAKKGLTDSADSASRLLDQKYMDLSAALKLREEQNVDKYRQLIAEDRKLLEMQLKTLQMKLDYLEQKVEG